MTKLLLKEFEKEGTLIKLILTLIKNDPKQFLHNITNISNFDIAKFGGLKKLDKILNKLGLE